VPVRIGVISDTHGLVRAAVLDALRGVDLIVHAGDVGGPAVVLALEAVAPVKAVCGNVDLDPWGRDLPTTVVVEAGGVRLYVRHDLGGLDVDPRTAGFAAVITGHSHRPGIQRRDGVLYFNPGSAGPVRFSLPVCVGRLTIEGTAVDPEILLVEA
jgi:hypothetical protein